MKGKIMTTDTTVETVQTPQEIAEEFVKANTTSVIIEEFVNHHNTIESLRRNLEYAQQDARNQRARWASMAETIEDFLKTHISEKDSASVEELKDLADELEIELTKTMRVTFKIEAEYEIVVPLDTNEDDISEDNFDYSVSFRNTNDDWEENSESYEINDFEVEEA